ncbi:hypothetical protein [Haloarcula halophila]|uniref:hypothetical protein n=1 Tax=Haloarcula TaxID=2237 RepID=UPI0023E38149|nr:hypothetical protein [Halomicroarcula sp. DFY41]
MAEFYEEFPDRASLPLTETHGSSLRREYTWERREEYHSEPLQDTENAVSGSQVVWRKPVTWAEAVRRTLENHEETRRTTINLECGRPSDPEYAEFSIDADNRWFASYQRRYYAQMKAWLREIVGGERPSGGLSEGAFDDPHIALVTLSASSVPDTERVGPIDHMETRRSSWSDCYHTLRNTMRSLGLDLGDGWQYDRRSEPHTGERGGGLNHCYGHDHIVIVTDGEVTPSDLRPVVEKHVESCDWAGKQAHELHKTDWDANRDDLDTVTVKPASEVDDLANYVASYCGIQPTDLLERSTKYIAWASAVTAANVKTVSRSDAAKHAAAADACKQRYESDRSDQGVDHGESILRSDRRGYDFECACCGSPHGIDQSHDTLTAARTAAKPVADGGVDTAEKLRRAWPSARAAATIGEGPTRKQWRHRIENYLERYPDASIPQIRGALDLPHRAETVIEEVAAGIDRTEVHSFHAGPEWHVKSVTVGEEEYPASSGNGVDMVETIMPVERLLEETKLGDDGNEATCWRCERTDVHMYRGRAMAGYLLKHDIVHPRAVDEVVTAVRGPLAED